MSQPAEVQPAAPAAAQTQPPAPPAVPPAVPTSATPPNTALPPAAPIGPTWEQIIAGLRSTAQPAAPPPVAPVVAQPPAQPAAPASPAAPVDPASSPEVVRLQEQLHAALIRSSVEHVATDLGALNSADVLTLMGNAFAVDASGRVMVRGQPGVAVKDAVAAFLNTRPHMMRPAVPSGGSGAPAAPAAAPAAPPPTDPNTPEGATAVARSFLGQILTPAAPSARPST